MKLRVRWLLPLLFIIGYIATFSIFEDFALEYFVLTGVSFLVCCLLLSVLNRPLQITAPVWVLLLLFLVAYYLKFYWIAPNPEIIKTVWFTTMHWIDDSPAMLLKGYAATTYAFIIFCLTAWLLVVHVRPLQVSSTKREIDYRFVISILLWLVPILMVATTYLMYITQIAIMGAESKYLPFRLAGVIFYTRFTIIPALLLLLIWCGDQMGSRKHLKLGITLLFLHGLSDVLLRGSKGFLLLLFISLLFLFLLTGRMNKQRAWLVIIIAFLSIMLWPLVSTYRYIRDADGGIIYTLVEAVNTILQTSPSLPNILGETLKMIMFRFTGMEGLLPIVAAGIQPLGITSLFDPIVERVFTVEVVGYSPFAIQGTAPSLLGWFYLVGGNYVVVAGVFCFVLLTWVFWSFLAKIRLLCLPVAQALFLILVFGFSMEGAMDRINLGVLTTAGSIAVCELIIRNSVRPHWLKMSSFMVREAGSQQ